MKIINIVLPVILLIIGYTDRTFKDFKKYIAFSYRIPSSVKEDCNWHYAVILIKTDKLCHIKTLSVLNEVSNDMQNSFNIIKKYKFPIDENLNEKSIVFCLSLDNHKEDCVVPNTRNYSPSEVLQSVLFYYGDQVKRNPKTIIIQEPIILPVYDPIK